jgi:hypothetical protein
VLDVVIWEVHFTVSELNAPDGSRVRKWEPYGAVWEPCNVWDPCGSRWGAMWHHRGAACTV